MTKAEELVLHNITEIQNKYWVGRRNEIARKWDFFRGAHSRYMPRFKGETPEDYYERTKDSIYENLCKATSYIATTYLYGSGEIGRRCEDEEAQGILQNRIYVTNRMKSLMFDAALMASVTGFAPIALELVDIETGKPFEKGVGSRAISKRASIKYKLLDSADTMPLPRADDVRQLGAILRIYDSDNFSGSSTFDRLRFQKYVNFEVIEFIDDARWLRWIKEGTEWVEVEVAPGGINPYGDITVPFMIFKNPGDPMILEGESDLEDVIPLNIDLNERINDDRNVISYHSFPILKMLKGAQMPDNFKRTVSSALEFAGDQDAAYLTWSNEIEASERHQLNLRNGAFLASGMGALSRGALKDSIGQIRSGAALRTLFQADILTILRKQIFADLAERWLIKSTLKMLEKHTNLKFNSYESEITFPEDFLGIEELLKVQAQTAKMESAIESLFDIIKREHPELVTDAEVWAKVRENIELREKVNPAKPKTETSDAKMNQQQVGAQELQ